jgi:hypothetical protein
VHTYTLPAYRSAFSVNSYPARCTSDDYKIIYTCTQQYPYLPQTNWILSKPVTSKRAAPHPSTSPFPHARRLRSVSSRDVSRARRCVYLTMRVDTRTCRKNSPHSDLDPMRLHLMNCTRWMLTCYIQYND